VEPHTITAQLIINVKSSSFNCLVYLNSASNIVVPVGSQRAACRSACRRTLPGSDCPLSLIMPRLLLSFRVSTPDNGARPPTYRLAYRTGSRAPPKRKGSGRKEERRRLWETCPPGATASAAVPPLPLTEAMGCAGSKEAAGMPRRGFPCPLSPISPHRLLSPSPCRFPLLACRGSRKCFEVSQCWSR